MPLSREPTISKAQKRTRSGQLTEQKQGPTPPDKTGDINHCVRSAQNLPSWRKHFHFIRHLAHVEAQAFPGSSALKRSRTHAALLQPAVKVSHPAPAKGARRIVEHVTLDVFCNFCMHRNSCLKFFMSPTSTILTLC